MKNKNKALATLFIGLFVLIGAFAAKAAFADTFTTTSASSGADIPLFILSPASSVPSSSCVTVTSGLFYGASDSFTHGDVSKLQAFLISRGYLNTGVTGFYGLKTFAAVSDFQRRTNISPIGLVGPLTRAKIYEVSCGSVVTTPPVNANSGSPVIGGIDAPTYLAVGQTGIWNVRAADPQLGALSYQVTWGDENQNVNSSVAAQAANIFFQTSSFSHAYSQAGTYAVRFNVQNTRGQVSSASATVQVGQGGQVSAPQITSLSPSTGGYNTMVTITGSGFTRYNNSINFANTNNVVVGVESTDGQTVRFAVPASPCASGSICTLMAIGNGSYAVSVSNANGTSNSLNFNLNTGTASGVQQAVTLTIGQQATINGELTLKPTRIVEDSRCPSGVACIQAGTISVETQAMRINGSTMQTFNLSLGSNNSPTFVTADGYTVRLVRVTPERSQWTNPNTSDYAVTYEVTR